MGSYGTWPAWLAVSSFRANPVQLLLRLTMLPRSGSAASLRPPRRADAAFRGRASESCGAGARPSRLLHRAGRATEHRAETEAPFERLMLIPRSRRSHSNTQNAAVSAVGAGWSEMCYPFTTETLFHVCVHHGCRTTCPSSGVTVGQCLRLAARLAPCWLCAPWSAGPGHRHSSVATIRPCAMPSMFLAVRGLAALRRGSSVNSIIPRTPSSTWTTASRSWLTRIVSPRTLASLPVCGISTASGLK